jgi:hypothetical protein
MLAAFGELLGTTQLPKPMFTRCVLLLSQCHVVKWLKACCQHLAYWGWVQHIQLLSDRYMVCGVCNGSGVYGLGVLRVPADVAAKVAEENLAAFGELLRAAQLPKPVFTRCVNILATKAAHVSCLLGGWVHAGSSWRAAGA